MTGILEGQVALVTGAGGGIGFATARAFAEAGAAIVVADRDEEKIGKAAEALRSAGHNVIGLTRSAALEYAAQGSASTRSVRGSSTPRWRSRS